MIGLGLKFPNDENRELDLEKSIEFAERHFGAILDKIVKHKQEEAVKEFAEKLTNIICEKIEKSMSNPNGDNYFITDVYTDIDNLVNEMTEKEGGKG